MLQRKHSQFSAGALSGAIATLLLSLASVSAGTSIAHAQSNPELGDVSGSGSASGSVSTTTTSSKTTWQPPTGSQSAAAADTSTTTTATTNETTVQPAASDTEHGAEIGSWGVGFFGITDVPICLDLACGPPPGGDNAQRIVAPTIGVRYWLSDLIGLEGAIGFNTHSGGGDVKPANSNVTGSYDDPSYTAFALHLGVPLALADMKHFTFEVIPDLNLGISGGSLRGPTAAQDQSFSGFLFQLGGRIGAEVHFGFIDLPKLSLVASVGLHMTADHRSAEVSGSGQKISHNTFGISTSVDGQPWDIFAGNIAAIYYF